MINTSERFINFILAPNSAAWVLKKKKKTRERAQVSMFSLVSQPPSSHGRSMGSIVNSCILQCGLAKIITKQLGIYSHHSLMVLLKGARPAVSQSDAWVQSAHSGGTLLDFLQNVYRMSTVRSTLYVCLWLQVVHQHLSQNNSFLKRSWQ